MRTRQYGPDGRSFLARWSGLLLSVILIGASISLGSCSRYIRPVIPGPPEAPSILGVIVQMSPMDVPLPTKSFLVEGIPGTAMETDRAWVTITGQTRLFRQTGRVLLPATADALVPATYVAVWFWGPVMESYPVQATAGTVVLLDGPDAETGFSE